MGNPVASLVIALGAGAIAVAVLWPGWGLLARYRRTAGLSERVLQEDALKYICKCEAQDHPATIENIAGNIGISQNQTADVLRELEEGKLVRHEGQRLLLTSEGRAYALNVIRAHRLYELYLADETGYAEKEWHDIAERREHALSPGEIEDLSERLGSPLFDPHGDPIPTEDHEEVFHGGVALTTAEQGTTLRIVHLEDEPETVYAQLVAEGLRPGMRIYVTEAAEERIRFWADGEEHILAPIVAANIAVVPEPREEPEEEMMDGAVRLASLATGARGEVVRIARASRGPERRRLMDLGVLPGTEITAEMTSPSGDLTAYRVRGALIALRKDQAELIRVRPIDERVAK